jgi:flotillin
MSKNIDDISDEAKFLNSVINNTDKLDIGKLAVAGGLIGAGVFLSMRYRVAKPNEFVAKTGLAIRGISLSKKTLQWPFQTAQIYDVNPFGYNFDLKCMSNEMIEMKLPIAFTMQPITPDKDIEGATNYARRMLNISDKDALDTISNALEGTTRTLSGQLSIDELFHNRDAFRDKVVNGVQSELHGIGLEIVTANIQEMGDYDEKNQYFAYRKQRATESANHQARVDVADAKMKGEIGVADRESSTRIQIAAFERNATIAENERNKAIAKSNAELIVAQAEADKDSGRARAESEINVEMHRTEMEKELEIKRRERQMESERATKLAPTLVNKEKIETDAQAELYRQQREADAMAYKVEKSAEARLTESRRDAEAILMKAHKEAEAMIALKEAEAKGILAIKQAEAEGLEKILSASQGDTALTQFYLGLNKELPQTQYKEAANALRGLNPKVHIWNTGNTNGDTNPVANVFADMAMKLIPTLDATKGDIKIPSYLPQPK